MHPFLPTTMAAFVSVVLSSLAGAAAPNVVADTRFNRERGFYDSGFAVVIQSRTAGARIRYTTDGSAPSPDVLIAASYQRRRHVWTLIDGGPESALYKSTDGGESWDELTGGLPSGDVGRIGLAQAPARPDVVYAIIEAANDAGGLYRSVDAGVNWEKRGDYVSGSPQYYQELVVDPHDSDRVYSLDTWMMVSEDGGSSFERVGERFKHVDNHALLDRPGGHRLSSRGLRRRRL